MAASFTGRTIHLVSDLSRKEQLFLYDETRKLKGSPEKRGSSKATVYLIFCDESTRTKGSFSSAAAHQGMSVTDVPNARELLGKETAMDVVKMLASYSTGQSIFVVRSPMEGLCRWLERAFPVSPGAPIPSFINAGDGRHTHPTLEYVDVYTLLELNQWSRDSIHIALVGDLLNSRTAHSKVDGLRIFDSVTVDLIAPSELEYPVEYQAKMESNGFKVKLFPSIEEYLNSGAVARLWSFSRLQMSRLGDEARSNEGNLRRAVTFRKEWRERLPEGAKFLQSLPRDRSNPLVPFCFDSDTINAWETASANGYWVRRCLLGMISGSMGDAAVAPSPSTAHHDPNPDFVKTLSGPFPPSQTAKMDKSILPFESGIVIDHITRGADRAECWASLDSIRAVMGWMGRMGTQGVYTWGPSPDAQISKAVMSLPDMDPAELTSNLAKLAALAPGCTLNVIKNGIVAEKYRLSTPGRVCGFPNAACGNENCVSHKSQNQPDVHTDFTRVPFYVSSALKGKLPAYELRVKGALAPLSLDGSDEGRGPPPSPASKGNYLYVCRYCLWPHFYRDIWVPEATVKP